MKNKTQVSTESLVIIGSNFISNSLYNNYKRNSIFKVTLLNDINLITHKPKYIIDCTLDKFKQDQIITYCNYNNIDKLLIINHWERTNLPESKTLILQAIVYDVYGSEHMSFHRPGSGNNTEESIKYCTLICEAIRRIHDSKSDFLPITYIPYGETIIKYIHVDNIYEPINYMLCTLDKKSTYSIYDDEKNIESLISSIKDILNYTGNVVVINENRSYTKYIKSLDFNLKKNKLPQEIKKIYNYLLYNNYRFMSDY